MLDPSLFEGSEPRRGAFERFDADARRAVVVAEAEAQRRNHGYISTDHLLLGVLANPDCRAVKGLRSLGVSAGDMYVEISETIGGVGPEQTARVPFAPQTKKAFEYSVREALALKHRYIGTEHLLLGVAREGSGTAGPSLKRRGAGVASLQAEFGGAAPGFSRWLTNLVPSRNRT